MKLNRFVIFFLGTLLFANPAFSQIQVSPAMRVHDLIDGFMSYQASSLQIGNSDTADQIVPWGQGDVGDSSIKVIDIYGKVRRQLLYIYQQGENDDKSLHDAGAFGGAKQISASAMKEGVDCESGPQRFQHAYVPVEVGQNLCIKTRSGKSYAVVRILAIGPNGIRLVVLAGAQSNSQFAPL